MQLDTPLNSVSVCHDKDRDALRVEGSLHNVMKLAQTCKLTIRLHGMKFGTPRHVWQQFKSAVNKYRDERVDVILSDRLGTGRGVDTYSGSRHRR